MSVPHSVSANMSSATMNTDTDNPAWDLGFDDNGYPLGFPDDVQYNLHSQGFYTPQHQTYAPQYGPNNGYQLQQHSMQMPEQAEQNAYYPDMRNHLQQASIQIPEQDAIPSCHLTMAQEPIKCRSNAGNHVKSSFCVEPTPIVELHFDDVQEHAFYSNSPHIHAVAHLQKKDATDRWVNTLGLGGENKSSLNAVKEKNRIRAYFAFPYLEVEPEGTHRVLIDVFNMVRDPYDPDEERLLKIAAYPSAEFEVLKPNAAFPGLPSNAIAHHLNQCGIKTRPRKKQAPKRPTKAELWSVHPNEINPGQIAYEGGNGHAQWGAQPYDYHPRTFCA